MYNKKEIIKNFILLDKNQHLKFSLEKNIKQKLKKTLKIN